LLYVALTRARDTLVLTATLPGKGDPKWSTAAVEDIADREILAANSALDWLKLWLPRVTNAEDWAGDRQGKSKLLQWTIYSELDPRLALPVVAGAPARPTETPAPEIRESDASVLRLRLDWKYPFETACTQRAKSTVTELRRLHDEESAPVEFVRRDRFTVPLRPEESLTATEVGSAHHRFLQRVTLSEVGSVESLRREANRLLRERQLTKEELSSLDFPALASFWETELGKRIRTHSADVRRELPFTARFASDALLAILSADSPTPAIDPSLRGGRRDGVEVPGGDFVVVQGVADLAVVLPSEIWLVDFKTDRLASTELEQRTRLYSPQLRIYARALESVLAKPVTECWLAFLSPGTCSRVS
jgi:ATP-dependent helicase/nuclease subunit A